MTLPVWVLKIKVIEVKGVLELNFMEEEVGGWKLDGSSEGDFGIEFGWHWMLVEKNRGQVTRCRRLQRRNET